MAYRNNMNSEHKTCCKKGALGTGNTTQNSCKEEDLTIDRRKEEVLRSDLKGPQMPLKETYFNRSVN